MEGLNRGTARLDRAARRGREGFVLCGYCNGRLGRLTIIPDTLPTEPPLRAVELPSSMVAGQDGVFRRTAHKWHGFTTIRRVHRNTSWVRPMSKADYLMVRLARIPRLPATVDCPQCGELQLLDPEVLGVDPTDWEMPDPPADVPQINGYEDLVELMKKHYRDEGADEATVEQAAAKLWAQIMKEEREMTWDQVRGELLVHRDKPE